MKSIFNFRPLVVIFLSCIFGAVYNVSIAHIKDSGLGLFIFFTILLVLSILYIILGALNIDKNNFFKYLNKTYNVAIVFLLSFCIFGGIFNTAIKIKENYIIDINEEVTFAGKITKAEKRDGYFELELRNVKYSLNNNENKLHSNLKVVVYGNDEDGLKVGNIIKGKSLLIKYDIKNYNYYNYSSLYSTRLDKSKLTITESNPNLFEKIKLRTNVILNKFMNIENSGIAYAMLFGEKENIDSNNLNAFSMAGISHILAVSGLHIGVLVSFILFILKKLKTNKTLKISILSLVLLFYMFLCGFTPSVVRASIMSIILVLSLILGERYDSMSSLSLAGIIILLFNPLDLFSVGFQLSFASVFAIITLAPVLKRLFERIKFKGSISSMVAITLSVNFALIPFCACYFHKISLLSLLTNLIVLPLFSSTYIILFVLTVLSLIFEFVGYLLVVPDILIHFVKLVANFISSIKFNTLVIFDVGVLSFISILSFQYILQFMVGVPKLKTILCSILISIFSILLVFNCLPNRYEGNMIIGFKQYSSNVVLVNNDNNKTLVGFNLYEINRLETMLIEYRINKIDNIVLYENLENKDILNDFIVRFKIRNVYIPNKLNKDDIKYQKLINENEPIKIGKLEYNVIINNNQILGVSIKNEDKINFVGNKLNKKDLITISNILGYNVNVMYLTNVSFDLSEIFNYNVLVTQNSKNSDFNLDKNYYILEKI